MALYVIGDTHLSLGADKPMDVFGGRWAGYVEKLQEGFSVISPEDTTVLLGDLSWAMHLADAKKDFAFLNAIPGRKLIVKGNHDYWWSTGTKFFSFCSENGFTTLELLHNNCAFYGETALCGTRGWFFEEDRHGTHDEKVFLRELGRLETSLRAAGDREKICFLHYPPIYQGYRCDEIIQMMKQYGVRQCFYAHLHSESHRLAVEGEHDGIEYRLVSSDYLDFRPYRVL